MDWDDKLLFAIVGEKGVSELSLRDSNSVKSPLSVLAVDVFGEDKTWLGARLEIGIKQSVDFMGSILIGCKIVLNERTFLTFKNIKINSC